MKKNKAFKENLLELLNQDDDVKDFLDQMLTKKVEDVFINFLAKDDYSNCEKEIPNDNIESIIHNKIQGFFMILYCILVVYVKKELKWKIYKIICMKIIS